ncbi:MAG: ornithine carbamoyltransferase [Conexivisphaerales archaeon]|jgi:ornithine carbamoyltransferase
MKTVELVGRDLLSTQDWSREEVEYCIDAASHIKSLYKSGSVPELFKNKTMFMLFYNTSTRTRSSFEAAATILGGHSQFIDFATTRGSEGEAVKDVARMYERLGHVLGIRILENAVDYLYGKGHQVIQEYADNCDIPTVSMADDMFHPTQAIADMMTIKEKMHDKVERKNYVIAWTYTDHVRSWGSVQDEALIASRFGMDVTMAYPEGFDLDPAVMEWAKGNADASGSKFKVSHDLDEALEGAHVVFPRSWASHECVSVGMNRFGKEKEAALHGQYKEWILDQKKVDRMDKDSIVTHVLPVFRGQEATDEVMDGPHSVILDQAENLLYVRAAVLALLSGNM